MKINLSLSWLYVCIVAAVTPACTTHVEQAERQTQAIEAANKKPKPNYNHIRDAKRTLDRLILDKSCDASYQCKIIAIGAKACGGPSRYEMYSIKTAVQTEVEQIAEEITAYERALNKNQSRLGPCQHLLAPQSLCINNQCRLIDQFSSR